MADVVQRFFALWDHALRIYETCTKTDF